MLYDDRHGRLESAKIARRDRQHFDCATWLHKAREMPKEGFKQAVGRELTGRGTEPWEIIFFKLYKSQLSVVDRAIETAAHILARTNLGATAWK
jgi:hypothetical protein